MKKALFLVLSCLIWFVGHAQQPTAKDLEKLLKQAQKGLPSGDLLKNAPVNDRFKVPKKNTALLAAIPKKTFTQPELVLYMKTLLKNFETSPSNKKAIAFVKKNYPVISDSGYRQLFILLWYSGRQNEAMYVAVVAAAKPGNDVLVLNNFCALMNMSGYPHKSIPILRYALTKEPKNTLLLNNIGQAYYQLGDLATSSRYLSSCTSIDAYNVEANNTQGHIATAQGNTTAANTFYENSVKGGYNESAADQLKRNRPDLKLDDIIELPSPQQYPETDDNIPFECPDIPTNVTENPAYEARRAEETEAWSRLQEDYRTRANASMAQQGNQMMNSFMSGGRPGVKLGLMHKKAELAISKVVRDYWDRYNRLITQYGTWKEEFEKGWNDRMQNACNGASTEAACCAIMRALEGEKQAEFASRYRQFCSEVWTNAKGYYNCIAYWQPRYITGNGIFERELITARLTLLSVASSLSGGAGVNFSQLCMDAIEPGQTQKDVNFKEPVCQPLKIPLGVGGFELGCDKFKANFGELILGEIELNFKTFQSTIAFGVGGQVQSGVVNASVSAMHYVTFNGDLKVTDFGHRVQGSVGLVDVGGNLGLNALSAESSLTAGVCSGVNSSTGINAFNQTLFAREANLYSVKN